MEQSKFFRKNRGDKKSRMLVVLTTQSVYHLYTKCRKWLRERRVFRKELYTLGIGWQRQTEKRFVTNLLTNKQAVQPLLKYLITTKVGGQEGRTEKAIEWEQFIHQK